MFCLWMTAQKYFMTPFPCLQIDYYCRLDCLQKNKFKKEHESFETMENVNRLLLENVLPAHVAAHFIGDNKLNEVQRNKDDCIGLGLKVFICTAAVHQENLSSKLSVLGSNVKANVNPTLPCSTLPYPYADILSIYKPQGPNYYEPNQLKTQWISTLKRIELI